MILASLALAGLALAALDLRQYPNKWGPEPERLTVSAHRYN